MVERARRFPRQSQRVAAFCIERRGWVVGTIAGITLVLLFFAGQQQIRTSFEDLLPGHHHYVRIHEQFKESFGGSNIVTIMVKAREGDIFQPTGLGTIRDITRELQTITGVNQFQIISLASKKLKRVHASTYGIESRPLMWPDLPESPDEMARLREDVISDPLVYGSYVSLDLKAALVTVDFIDRLMDYEKAFGEITQLVDRHQSEAVEVQVVGEPILQGWVRHYLPETLLLFVLTFVALGLILFFAFMRTLRGTLVPLINALVTAIWALGIARIFGLNFDPLSVVIAFLITARVASHCVQGVTRFESYLAEGVPTAKAAAQSSLAELWKPGMLSVVTDAGGVAVVALAPIPLLQKTAVIGTIWVACIALTGVILTPLLLSWTPSRSAASHRFDLTRTVDWFMELYARWTTGRVRYVILAVAGVIFVVSAVLATRVTIGDARPGTPLLWPDSVYNQAAAEINAGFLGTDRMFVVVSGEKADSLKNPEVLEHMARFERYAEQQPGVGGSVSLADLIPAVNRVLNEGNPRYYEVGADPLANGEMLYMYLAGSDPGDLDRFADVAMQNGSITLFFKDRKGETIRSAVSGIKRFIEENPIQGATYNLAGGLVGVVAAVNEVIVAGQVESMALALLIVLVTCSFAYRSGIAGTFFMVPILLSNVVTFAYMSVSGIGLNISTLPVAALGIGLGVDYTIYVIDAIKEAYAEHGNLHEAVRKALQTAGKGVVLTSTPLIACTALWYFVSSLRFQAEMAILIAIWMGVSAGSALLVMPALALTFKPKFVTSSDVDREATVEPVGLCGEPS
jgi:uncharacterized protein